MIQGEKEKETQNATSAENSHVGNVEGSRKVMLAPSLQYRNKNGICKRKGNG